jgi:CRISPR/Cas system-associated exonuclease Cas4 (RecB family)
MYNLPKQFLSASQINKYLTCPRQYELEYVKGIVVPKKSNYNMCIGSGVHKYVENHLKAMLESNGEPQNYTDILSLTTADITAITNNPEVDLEGQTPEATIDYAQKLYNTWYKELASTILPSSSEKKFEDVIGDVPVMGFIDYIDYSSGKPEVCDLKVVDKTKTITDAANSVQLAMYSIVEKNPCVRFDSVVKTKTPKLTQVRYEFSKGELQYYTDLIGEVATNISAGNFPRCKPDSWSCTSTWCSFFKDCRGSYGKE